MKMQRGEKLIKLRIGDRQYAIATDDFYLTQSRSDIKHQAKRLLKRLLQREGFEIPMTRMFATLIRPEFNILDVGANIGCTSLLFSDLGQQVIAFEPLPRTFELLQKNINLAQKKNIQALPFALGDEARETEMFFLDANRSMAFILDRTSRDDSQAAVIEVKRLDDVFPELGLDRLDLIKIDVEGYELRVLEGARQTINRYRPIVQMEFNSWTLNVQQRICLPDFIDFILALFPLAYAFHRQSFIDLRTTKGRYEAMAQNLLHQQYLELVCAFSEEQLASFKQKYRDATPH
ncbi:MAG: FkbM family methyltransferase [Cyanobacteria bacterium J06623_7]